MALTTTEGITNIPVSLTVNGGNGPLSFSWAGANPVCSVLDSQNVQNPVFDAPNVDQPDTETQFDCVVTVTDADGDTDSATVQFTINNSEPLLGLSANPGTSVMEGTAVTLTATASAGNPAYSNYTWDGDCAAAGDTNTFTLPSTEGTYTCGVTVDDSDGDTSNRAEITVIVNDNPPILTIDANPGTTVNEGTAVTLTANVTNGDPTFTYAWSGDCSGIADNFTLPATSGVYNCTLVVTDADGDIDSEGVTVTVNDYPPVVSLSSDMGTSVNEGATFIITATPSAGNPAYSNYVWGGDCTGTANTDTTVTFSNMPEGTITCTVTVDDSDGDTSNQATITVTINNYVPVVTLNYSPSPVYEDSGTLQVTANVTGGNPGYTYTWSDDCTGGNTNAADPIAVVRDATYTCTLMVEDIDGDQVTTSVNIPVNRRVPTASITAVPSNSVTSGQVINLTGSATGGNGAYTYQWGGSCSGNATTYTLNQPAGTYGCTFTVWDADGDSDTALIMLTVRPVTVKPETPSTIPGYSYWPIEPTQAEEPDTTVEEPGNIDGESVDTQRDGDLCTNDEMRKISGYVYNDKDKNEQKNDGDEGLKDVEVKVYYEGEEGRKMYVVTTKTNGDGYWYADLCPGKYFVEISEDDLPEKTNLKGDNPVEINLGSQDEMVDINFRVLDNGGFSYIYLLCCLIPLILIPVLFMIGRKEEGEEKHSGN